MTKVFEGPEREAEKERAHNRLENISKKLHKEAIAFRFISYYADDLTNMLIDDLLLDTVEELQKQENQCVDQAVRNDVTEEAFNMLLAYENEEHIVAQKWFN